MAKLLHILASPRVESYSTRVAKAFLDSYRHARPEDRIEVLDLFQADIPPFHAPQAKAKYAVIAGQTPRDEAEAAWQPVINDHQPLQGVRQVRAFQPDVEFRHPLSAEAVHRRDRPALADRRLFPRERLLGPRHGQAADADSGPRRRLSGGQPPGDLRFPGELPAQHLRIHRLHGHSDRSSSRARCKGPSRSRPPPARPSPRPPTRQRNSPEKPCRCRLRQARPNALAGPPRRRIDVGRNKRAQFPAQFRRESARERAMPESAKLVPAY